MMLEKMWVASNFGPGCDVRRSCSGCPWKTMENPMDFLPGRHHDSMVNLLLENDGKQMMGTWVNPLEPKDWVNMGNDGDEP